MRSTSEPCGTRSIAILFAIICACAFGFRPMWLAVNVDTSAASISLPIPLPGTAASLQTSESSHLRWRTSSSRSRSGVPTPMKPPTISRDPLGIIAMASSTDTVFIGSSDRRSVSSCPQTMMPATGNPLIYVNGPRRPRHTVPAAVALARSLHAYSATGRISRQRDQHHASRDGHDDRHTDRAYRLAPKLVPSAPLSGGHDDRNVPCADRRSHAGSLCLVVRLCHRERSARRCEP